MCFYLEGRTVSDGSCFKVEEEYWSIEAALEAAQIRMAYGGVIVWIKDHQQNLILSFQEVRERLGLAKAATT